MGPKPKVRDAEVATINGVGMDAFVRTQGGRWTDHPSGGRVLSPSELGSGDGHDPLTGSQMAPMVYCVEEAAIALRLSRSMIYELIRSGGLRTVKQGRRRLVPVAAIHEYLARLGGTP